MTVQELLVRMSSREITEWIVYFNLDKWKEHFAKKARESQTPDSAVVMQTLFGGRRITDGKQQ
jgi:hypothetical protein